MGVEKRGQYWCTVHGHAKKPGSKTDKPKGSIIKCYSIAKYGDAGAKRRALDQHKAIAISQAKQKAGK